jgi:hypothetical protein
MENVHILLAYSIVWVVKHCFRLMAKQVRNPLVDKCSDVQIIMKKNCFRHQIQEAYQMAATSSTVFPEII